MKFFNPVDYADYPANYHFLCDAFGDLPCTDYELDIIDELAKNFDDELIEAISGMILYVVDKLGGELSVTGKYLLSLREKRIEQRRERVYTPEKSYQKRKVHI